MKNNFPNDVRMLLTFWCDVLKSQWLIQGEKMHNLKKEIQYECDACVYHSNNPFKTPQMDPEEI